MSLHVIIFRLFLTWLLVVVVSLQSAFATAEVLDFMSAILAGAQNTCQVECSERTGGYQVPIGMEEGTDQCIIRVNDEFAWAFFELCGNYHISVEEPYRVQPSKETVDDRFVTLWMEVNAPFGEDGTVWFDGICLTIGDSNENIAPNPAFCISMDKDAWDSRENPIVQQYPEFPVCVRGVSDYADCNTMEGIVQDESKFSSQSLRVDVKADYRYHTYIDYLHFIDLTNLPIGTEVNASVYVKIEGDVQVRLGLDFRDTVDSDPDKMLNGKIIQFSEDGEHSLDWTLLTL